MYLKFDIITETSAKEFMYLHQKWCGLIMTAKEEKEREMMEKKKCPERISKRAKEN